MQTVIEVDGGFKILRLTSMSAYGMFETCDEAEQAIAASIRANQSIGADQ